MQLQAVKQAIHDELFIHARTAPGISNVNRLIVGLILFSLVISVIETEPLIYTANKSRFIALEIVLSLLFAIEYVFRLWTVSCTPGYQGFRGRLRYIFSPSSLIDLLAFLPTLITLGYTDGFILRIIRLAKLARFAKLGVYSKAIAFIERVLRSHGYELIVAFMLSLALLLLSATLLFLVEGKAQPEVFGSIPRTLWWSVVTLTTVGYGDITPITPLGKLCAGVVALVGVSTVALPAGILAGAFSQAYAKTHNDE